MTSVINIRVSMLDTTNMKLHNSMNFGDSVNKIFWEIITNKKIINI